METNQSLDIFFLFDGLTDDPELETALFIIILLIYIFTIVGNCGLIVMIMTSPILHTPMYSFLKHLAFIDMCYTSVVTPRTLSDLFSKKKDISFMACETKASVQGKKSRTLSR
uniref:G-protein coupled receptors family 1 profile domain-containing protein n=1 Tax=Xenopus tropicalis TaxID=8364 RepID=A0A6I8SIG2_XENTR